MRVSDRLAEIAQQARGGLKNRDVLALIPEISSTTLQRILEGRTEVSPNTWEIYIGRLSGSEELVREVMELLEQEGKVIDDFSLIEERLRHARLSPNRKVKALKYLRTLFEEEQREEETRQSAA